MGVFFLPCRVVVNNSAAAFVQFKISIYNSFYVAMIIRVGKIVTIESPIFRNQYPAGKTVISLVK